MKKIGFIGAFDKTNFIMYTAKLLQLLNYKVLVVDSSSVQKMRYIKLVLIALIDVFVDIYTSHKSKN